MALVSMTGYGQADDGRGLVAEVRTVNHRHLDVACRLPRAWTALEAEVRAEVGRRVRRGRVELAVRLDPAAEGAGLHLDAAQAARYLAFARTLVEGEGLPVNPVLDLGALLALPGVVVAEGPAPAPEAVRERLLTGVGRALEAAAAMRRREGEALEREIRDRLALVRQAVARIEARRPVAVAEAGARLKERVAALCAETPVDPARLAQEVAILAERSDVSEELARLASHLDQFEGALGAEEAVGRTLDFLLVELNREANTVGAKCQDPEIAAQVVFLKGEIEKVREQVQNVE
jgi:uncharacterized protein (TIGR00255 family)